MQLEKTEQKIKTAFQDSDTAATHVDRRLNIRRNIYLPFEYSGVNSAGEKITGSGTTVNISSGGAFFLCDDCRIKPGMRIEAYITVKSGLSPAGKIGISALVLRAAKITETEAAGLGIAVKFDESWKYWLIHALRELHV